MAVSQIGLVLGHGSPEAVRRVLAGIPDDHRLRLAAVLVCAPAHARVPELRRACDELVPGARLVVISPATAAVTGAEAAALQAAVAQNLDAVVVCDDWRCAAQCMGDLLAPIERGEADAVVGCHDARRSLLTTVGSSLFGARLPELHEGCRAYTAAALRAIDVDGGRDAQAVHTQAIMQMLRGGARIAEVPLAVVSSAPASARGLGRAWRTSAAIVRFRLASRGFHAGAAATPGAEYRLKDAVDSSHGVILGWLAAMPPSRILDLGCSGGAFAQRARALGHHVTGVDFEELLHVRERCDVFLQADLDQGLPQSVSAAAPYDAVVCADVLEHLRTPQSLVAQLLTVLSERGSLMVSVPNFGHWYARARTTFGVFDYDRRGILDEGHLRFYTRRSFERLMRRTGLAPVRHAVTGLPLEALTGEHLHPLSRVLKAVDRAAVAARPTLFAYQLVYELRPAMAIVVSDVRHAAA